jgi:ribosomal protein S18 acetylase RimI-like enzyme
MNQVCTRTACTWAIRHLEPRDLAQIFRLTRHAPPRCARQNFLNGLLSAGLFSRVAEAGNQLVGFVVCRIAPRRKRVAVTRPGPRGARGAARRGDPPRVPFRLELLYIAVAPEYRRGGIGKALLTQFEEWLSEPGDRIEAAVPESNLPLQLFLRSLGYRAVRVLRGRDGEEDAYAMERRRA